jgi:hypothetical protein
MMVAIAMGLLTSEISHPAYRDLVLTFHETPTFHKLLSSASFSDRAKSLHRAPWGGSTDFYGAMLLIAKVVRDNRLTAEEVPDLMVVSDMQFDDARDGRHGSWECMYVKIERLFADLGQELHGKSMRAPGIIFWNVRSSEGYPCAADQEGVMMISGYSANLMKFVLSGEMETEEVRVDEKTGKADVVKRRLTPEETLRKMLDDSGLKPVRDLLTTKFKAQLGKVGGETDCTFASLLSEGTKERAKKEKEEIRKAKDAREKRLAEREGRPPYFTSSIHQLSYDPFDDEDFCCDDFELEILFPSKNIKERNSVVKGHFLKVHDKKKKTLLCDRRDRGVREGEGTKRKPEARKIIDKLKDGVRKREGKLKDSSRRNDEAVE